MLLFIYPKVKKTTIVAITICALFFGACKNKQKTGKQEESFPITGVIKINTHTSNDYVTEIHALQNIEIRARVSGYLDKIYVDEGATVKENQLLFSINNKEYIEELAKAKAQYKIAITEVKAAELELKNTMQLADKKIVSSTETELAKNKLEAQKAKMEEVGAHLAQAQIKLSNTEIRAPFSGTINRIPHKMGSLINEGTLLTSLSDNNEVFAYFDVSEKEYLEYARNIKKFDTDSISLSLILADGSEHRSKGKIETVEGIIDDNTGNIAFRARFDNPDKIIKHGASGRVRIKKKYNNAIVVPQKSTFEIQNKLYVYVLNKKRQAVIREIETAYRLPHLFIVNKGIKEGELIIYEGIQNIKTDMIIQPQVVKMKDIIQQAEVK